MANMLESLGANLKDQLSPHASKLSQEIKVFGDTLFDRLDKLIANTDSPEFQERRVRRYLTPTVAGGPVYIDVPQAEDWTLDMVAIVPTAASTVTLRQGNLLVFAQNYPNSKTDFNIGAAIQGGTQLSVAVTADSEISLVFKVRVPKPSLPANTHIGNTDLWEGRTEGGNEVQRHIAPGINDATGGTALPIGTNNR